MKLKNNFQSSRVCEAVAEIKRIKEKNLLAPVTVLLPFQNLSRTIEKEFVKQKLSFVNVSFMTLPIIIKTETQLYKYLNNLSSINNDEKRNLFSTIIKTNKLPYFEKILEFNSVPMLFMQTVNEFRLETSDDSSIQGLKKFCEKGEDLLKIINAYEHHLKKNNLIDYADECKIFINEIKFSETHTYISLLPNEFEYSYLEKECLKTLKNKTNYIKIKSQTSSNQEKIIDLKCAPFETLEVKDVFRDIIKKCKTTNASFKDFCIVCPTEDYVEIIRSYAELAGIPCEFDTGIRTSKKRGFELFNSIVSLFLHDFQFADFKRFLQLYKKDIEEDNYSKSQLLKTSRKVFAAEGLEKNIRLLNDKIIKHKKETETDKDNNKDDYILNALFELQKILEKFSKISKDYSDTDTISHHISFLKIIVNEFINLKEKKILLKCINSLNSDYEQNNIEFDYVYENIKKEINSVRMYHAPLKSSVFVTRSKNIPSFDYVFSVGLNDEHYPKRCFQNPVLLDDEKKILNAKFNTHFTLTDEKNNYQDTIFENMVSSADIEWTGYFSTMDTMSGKERIPSFYFIPVYEAMPDNIKITASTKKDEWDEFIKRLKKDKEMVSQDTENALTEFEYHFGKMRTQQSSYFQHLLSEDIIKRTYMSEISKWKLNFNEYSGIIKEKANEDEFRSSPTALEGFMSCPYAYWLQRELRIKPLEEPVKTDSLDAMTIGTICHEALAEFMSKNIGKNISESDLEDLLKIADKKLQNEFKKFELKYEINEIKNSEEIKKIMKMFIDFEKKNDSEPFLFEKEFGRDESQQERIDIDTGKNKIKLAGSIDRVDKTDDGYKIIDYKTSKNKKYVKEDIVFNGGIMLQPYLYAEALKKLVNIYNKKILTGYLPLKTVNDKPLSEKVVEYNETIKNQLFEIIDFLSELRKNGIYFQSGNCEYCSYIDVCGTMVELQTKKKLENDKSEFVTKYNKINEWQ